MQNLLGAALTALRNSQGRGRTSSKNHVYSVKPVDFEGRLFVLASGNSDKLDIFDFDTFSADVFTGKCGLGFVTFLFLEYHLGNKKI